MTVVAGETKPAIIVTDTSVLINFLRIDRTDLTASHSHDFLATDHATAEISDRYPDQQQRFAEALDAGIISETRVTMHAFDRQFDIVRAAGGRQRNPVLLAVGGGRRDGPVPTAPSAFDPDDAPVVCGPRKPEGGI